MESEDHRGHKHSHGLQIGFRKDLWRAHMWSFFMGIQHSSSPSWRRSSPVKVCRCWYTARWKEPWTPWFLLPRAPWRVKLRQLRACWPWYPCWRSWLCIGSRATSLALDTWPSRPLLPMPPFLWIPGSSSWSLPIPSPWLQPNGWLTSKPLFFFFFALLLPSCKYPRALNFQHLPFLSSSTTTNSFQAFLVSRAYCFV